MCQHTKSLHIHVYLLCLRTHSGNFTTNLAESWMHIRTKFEGGKVINWSYSGSWEVRCAGAGLRANKGPEWGPRTWERITGKAANDVFVRTAAEKA